MLEIGAILFGAGMVEIVIRYYASDELVNKTTQRVLKGINMPISEFYISRKDLPNLNDELSAVDELWVAWHVGSYAQLYDFFPGIRKGRVIITNFKSPQIEMLGKISTKSASSMISDIKELKKTYSKEIKKNVELKMFDGSICNSILIANPTKPTAWARVEIIIPNKETPDIRPNFVVRKKDSEELFNNLFNSYEWLWQNSKEPEGIE